MGRLLSAPQSGTTGPALLLPPLSSPPLSLLRPLSAPQSGTTGPALLHPSPPPPLRSSAATPLPLLLQLPHTLALPATTSPPLPCSVVLLLSSLWLKWRP